MEIMITDQYSHRTTVYKPCELIKDARRLVRGKGTLSSYYVHVHSNGNVQLVATYKHTDGWVGRETEAI